MDQKIFTITSINYLHKAEVLYKSVKSVNQNCDFTLVICDKKQEIPNFEKYFYNLDVIWAEDLFESNKKFKHFSFKFNVIEFNTLLKPIMFEILLKKYEQVIYLDPDIKVFNKLEFSQNYSIILTPHYTTSLNNWSKRPNDLDLLRFGANNLGFICVNKTEESNKFIHWWKNICHDYNFYEPSIGLGVDQKFIDLVPILFNNSIILKDLGMNLAFWNIHERNLIKKGNDYFVNDKIPLKFIHFSSFPINCPSKIADKQTIYNDYPNNIFKEIWEIYKNDLITSSFYDLKNTPYSFNYFEDGMIINDFIRRNYVDFINKPDQKWNNPFETNSNYRKNLKKNHIKLSKTNNTKINFKLVDENFSRIDRLFDFLFRTCLFVLGPYKYDLFTKYLNFKTISTKNKHESNSIS